MATFVYGYISDLSPVKDNIKLRVRILRAWLQPLYNNQQVKNMEMIVMDEHHHLKEDVVGQVIAFEDLDNYDKNRKAGKKPVTLIDDEGNEIKCTLWGDYSQQFNDFLNSCDDHDRIVLVLQFAMMKFWDGNFYESDLTIARCVYKMGTGALIYIFLMATKLYMKMDIKRSKFRQRLFANQPSEQSENNATKISTASKNSTKDTFVNKHPIQNITELLDVEQGVQSVIVGTVIAIQEDEGWWYLRCRACRGKVIKSTDYIDLESEMPKKWDRPNDWWCRKCNAWVALIKSQFRLQIRVQDETGTMSLSLFNDEVRTMVGRSAYQLCEKYAKDNEATSNIVMAITLLDLESQTDKNTTPNEKQKTNKRPAKVNREMQQQDTNVVTTSLPFGLNRYLTLGNSIVSQRHVLSNTTTNANRTQMLPNSTTYVATRGHVRQTPKQSTNLETSPLAFGNSKMPTLENSNG
nr:hypothetical protein [Tanacetum cinerariifolium]